MTSPSYEIAPHRPEWDRQVAGLMMHLWGSDIELNLAYLRWKYTDNPCARDPLAVVALHEGQVVGFRGYMPLPFRTPAGAELLVLCPGDACVHPAHRMAGLSVKMGQAAMQSYAGRYPLFMNWSSSHASLPGYRKMGFQALADKQHLTHAGALGTLRYLLALHRSETLARSRVRFGRFGDVDVDAAPRPAKMAALAGAEEAEARPGLVLHRDEEFLAWRFANPRGRYVFYYLLHDEAPAAYVAVRLSANNRRGFLLDYVEREQGALEEIVRFILRARHFDVVSVYAFCLTEGQRRMLESLGFGVTGLFQRLDELRNGRLPLFIRPVKELFGNDDFLVEGVDAREISAWSLKPIGSDAV